MACQDSGPTEKFTSGGSYSMLNSIDVRPLRYVTFAELGPGLCLCESAHSYRCLIGGTVLGGF